MLPRIIKVSHSSLLWEITRNSQSFLVVDRKVVSKVPIEDVPLCLLAVFYVLNIHIPLVVPISIVLWR